ncbi:MAG TPA: hypothetical protein VMC48_02435 [Methanobacterium sp.]|nr:hypothetical protein [Methanobacterium sp.]
MVTQKIYFIAPLACVEPSITNLNKILEKGFKVVKIESDKFTEFFKDLTHTTYRDAKNKINTYNCVYDDTALNGKEKTLIGSSSHVFYVYNSFLVEVSELDQYSELANIVDDLLTYYNLYLNPLIKLLRLYSEGNIHIPFFIFYYIDTEGNALPLMQNPTLYFETDLQNFKLNDYDIWEFNELLKNNKISGIKYLKLAFEIYQTSFDVHKLDLKFLILMNAIEVLFNPSDNFELKYRISRYFAALIGETREESVDYFDAMKTFFDKRSIIVHSGSSRNDPVTVEDVLKLRDHVRKSIIKLSLIIDPDKKEKDEKKRVEKVLDKAGLGENPFNF